MDINLRTIGNLYNNFSNLLRDKDDRSFDEKFYSWLVSRLKFDYEIFLKYYNQPVSDILTKYYSQFLKTLEAINVQSPESFRVAIKSLKNLKKEIIKDHGIISEEEKEWILGTIKDILDHLNSELKLLSKTKTRTKNALKNISSAGGTLAKGLVAASVYNLGNPLLSAIAGFIIYNTNEMNRRKESQILKEKLKQNAAKQTRFESEYRKSVQDRANQFVGPVLPSEELQDQNLNPDQRRSKLRRLEGASKWSEGLERLKLLEQSNNVPELVGPRQPLRRPGDWSGMRFAAGGFVSGKGTSKSDSIHAMLSNGEYVLNAEATKAIGIKNLDRLNGKKFKTESSNIRGYADGGEVSNNIPTPRKSLFQKVTRNISEFSKDKAKQVLSNAFTNKNKSENKTPLSILQSNKEVSDSLSTLVSLMQSSVNEQKQIKSLLEQENKPEQEHPDFLENRKKKLFGGEDLGKMVSSLGGLMRGLTSLLGGGLLRIVTSVIGVLFSGPILGSIAAGLTAFGIYKFLPQEWQDKIKSVLGEGYNFIKEKASNAYDYLKEKGNKLFPSKGTETGISTYQVPEEIFNTKTKILDNKSKEEFIKQMIPVASKISKELNVPIEAIIAQSAQETGWGRSILKTKEGESSQNLFNMKIGTSREKYRKGELELDALEYDSAGKKKYEKSKFPVYESVEQSGLDYLEYIKRKYKTAPGSKSTEEYIQKLKEGGYATDPRYVKRVVNISEQVKKIIEKDKDILNTSVTNTNIDEQKIKLLSQENKILPEVKTIEPESNKVRIEQKDVTVLTPENIKLIKDASKTVIDKSEDIITQSSKFVKKELQDFTVRPEPKVYKFKRDEEIDIKPFLNKTENEIINLTKDTEEKIKLLNIKTKKDLYEYRISQVAKSKLPEGYEEQTDRYGGKEIVKKSDIGLFGHVKSDKIFISKEDAWKDLRNRDEVEFNRQMKSEGVKRISELESGMKSEVLSVNKPEPMKNSLLPKIELPSYDSSKLQKLEKLSIIENPVPEILTNKTREAESKSKQPIVINNTPVTNIANTSGGKSRGQPESDSPMIVHDPNSAIINALSSLHQLNFI